MKRLALVSCVSVKAPEPQPAKDLYQSNWFRLARRWVEHHGYEWLILSAEHAAVEPTEMIAPYEKTLKKMTKPARQAWADRVLATLEGRLVDGDAAVLLAGETYREFLVPALESRGVTVSIPLEGLGIGEQMAWLKRHTGSA